MTDTNTTPDPRRAAAALTVCEGVPTDALAGLAESSAPGLLANALAAVFFAYIEDGMYEYLGEDDVDLEDPDDVRANFADAIEYTLERVHLESTAENCGTVGDLILAKLPALARFLEETSDQ